MYRAIMVPLDGSNFSERALPMALAIARRDGADLHLVNVSGLLEPGTDESGDPIFNTRYEQEIRDDMIRYLESMREKALAAAPVTVSTAVIQGSIGLALDEYAETNNVDLTVMATHGRGGLNRTWLGSVAESVIRRGGRPIILTRPQDDKPADLHERVTVKRVLIPLADSRFSESVLPYASHVASVFDAEIALAQVVTPIELHARALTAPVIDVDDEKLAKDTAAATEFLDKTAMRVGINGRTVTTHVLTARQTAQAIIDAADDMDAGIIAMATHARSGVSRMVLGSVADKVVRGTTRAVLLFHPD